MSPLRVWLAQSISPLIRVQYVHPLPAFASITTHVVLVGLSSSIALYSIISSTNSTYSII